MLNLVVPIITNNESPVSRSYPLALHEISGKTLMEYTLSCIRNANEPINYIFIISENDCLKYHLDGSIKILFPSSKIIVLKSQTKGTVCSVLMSIDEMQIESELIIYNYNQFFSFNIFDEINNFRKLDVESGVFTFSSIHPRWAFALVENNCITQTAEKRPISENAIAGLYYFKNTKTFVDNAYEVIKTEDSHNGNFYLSTILNQYILNGQIVYSKKMNNADYFTFYSENGIVEFEKYIFKHG